MDGEWRKRIQVTLVVFMVLALARVGIILYERNHEPELPKSELSSSSSYKVTLDDYVTPHKLYPYDLRSAREAVGKTVWVRSGNQLPYYSYSAASRSADVARKAGLLGPLEKLEIKDVIAQTIRGQKQVLAVFTKEGAAAEYAVAIGKTSSGTYDFFVNDVFFIDDPHQLYNHWPAQVWNAVDHHQVKPGMNELQAGFALGTNIRVSAGEYGNRSVQYLNGDQSTMVSFSGNKAVSVEPGGHP
jgi:hypothetical protein